MSGRGGGTGSALTWAALREVKCAELEEAADGWGRVSNRADAARDRVEGRLLPGLRETQKGEAVDAAVRRLRRLGTNFQYIYTECGLLRTALNSLAHEIRAQQRALQDALDDAGALRFTVHPDGSVTYPAAGEGLADGKPLPGGTASGVPNPGMVTPSGLVAPNPNAGKAQDIADRVAQAVRTAADADWRYARILRSLKAQEGLGVSTATWTDAASDAAAVRQAARDYLKDAIPYDASPAERKAWWAGLTDEQREEYLAVYPDRIGNLDGIPALVRDAANRDNLQLLIGKLEGLHGDDDAETKLAALREIDRQLRAGTRPGEPPMYLLGIGDQGNGRAIVSYGNPDTSRNVAAYVPGLNTSLDMGFAEGDLKRARDLSISTNRHGSSAAVITWLGYDAPQSPGGLGTLDVAMGGRAEEGGAAFREFMNGIEVVNENENPHMTAIGHSYGSRTVGAATQHPGGIPGVDDIVFVGSPGVGVDRAEDLGVGNDHVFVGAAANDVVTKLPSSSEAAVAVQMLAGGPAAARALGGLVDRNDDDVWFGKDPASEAFGATRFKVGDGPPLVGGGGLTTDAHSEYFDPAVDKTSVENMALIAAGYSRNIKTEGSR
ncbi:alpha/beta hydrolase [Streptomyces sp. DH8]|uniref:alpha/beta hydrolase n=1 Tax=Streptomyces sp. DH8 TaxID=2857008 RepID=UPI001E635F95|nr:alpha/beta hydrolase [Streptomyces sp. DH8]